MEMMQLADAPEAAKKAVKGAVETAGDFALFNALQKTWLICFTQHAMLGLLGSHTSVQDSALHFL